ITLGVYLSRGSMIRFAKSQAGFHLGEIKLGSLRLEQSTIEGSVAIEAHAVYLDENSAITADGAGWSREQVEADDFAHKDRQAAPGHGGTHIGAGGRPPGSKAS